MIKLELLRLFNTKNCELSQKNYYFAFQNHIYIHQWVKS